MIAVSGVVLKQGTRLHPINRFMASAVVVEGAQADIPLYPIRVALPGAVVESMLQALDQEVVPAAQLA